MKKQRAHSHNKIGEVLEDLINKGVQSAKAYRRALRRGGWEVDRGKTYTEVCETIRVTIPTLSMGSRISNENHCTTPPVADTRSK